MVFSRFKHPLLIRLLGGIMLVLFSGWFVLPSCHCQWESLFGDGPVLADHPNPEPAADRGTDPGPLCHCDDCPAKIFELVSANDQGPDFRSALLVGNDPDLPQALDFPGDTANRGPPPGFHLIKIPGPRTYLRHLSLLL